jgi:hypothetical protein
MLLNLFNRLSGHIQLVHALIILLMAVPCCAGRHGNSQTVSNNFISR